MDKRKNYYLVIDTETAGTLEQPFVFDIGGAVIDKKGKVYKTFSFIVDEVFYGMPDLMAVCYYQSKLPQYRIDIDNGTRKVWSIFAIRGFITWLCNHYHIKAIMAHNAYFDYKALTNTIRNIPNPNKYFFPYGVEIWDTLKMAQDTICKQNSYKNYCIEYNFLCKNGRPRATAEILYRYITGNHDFNEEHTALADVLIEKDIFAHCIRQHKKMRKKLWSN